MATQPTQDAVPSESPRDLKFNAGKIDEFVTSMGWTYTDRFGVKHYTIEGINYLAQQVMNAFGYVTLSDVTFTTGATVSNPNEVLFNTADNTYYKWTGSFAGGVKVVPANSTPQSSGGVGVGKWLSVGDTVLRTELQRGQFRTDATSCYYVAGFVIDQTTNNRDAAYAFLGTIYIPKGLTIRCNFLPEDDVRKFTGEGVILTRDPWGHEHVFDVSKATNGSDFTVKGAIHQGMERKGNLNISVGVLGDSITDGAWGKQNWSSPPEGPSPARNLTSTNYDHSANGGSHSWFAYFVTTLNLIISRWTATPAFKGFNCSLSGEKLIDGWAYRNFDYGFFQNAAYGNAAPTTLLISMGWNDVDITDFKQYSDKFDALIRKAWGYGCSVGLVTVNMNESTRAGLEGAVKRTLSQKYKNLDYFDLGTYLAKRANSDLRNLRNYFIKVDGTYDYTHPQPLGQADVGNALLWHVCRDTYIPSVKSGEMVSWVNADKWWDCVGATTGTHYPLNWINAGGTPSLEKMGKIVQATPFTENVTMNTFVFCEEDDMSLSILEPFTFEGDYTTSSRVHNVTVFSPAGKALAEPAAETLRTLHLSQRLASGILGTQKTLTTFVGRLRYGINHVQVVYDGKPKSVFIPGLIFGSMSHARCSFDNIRLSKAPASVTPYFTRSKPLDGITSNFFDGSQFATLPDWFSSGDNLVGCLSVNEALADLSGVILCYKEDGQTGIAIQRNGTTIRVGEMSGGNVPSWTVTAVSGTAPFKVHFYQSSGTTKGVSISIVGSGLYEGVFAKSGGFVGTMNQGTGSAIYNLSYSAIDLGS